MLTQTDIRVSCKEIRREALKIFYHENCFWINTPAYNCESMMKFLGATKAIGIASKGEDGMDLIKTRVQFGCSPSWTNLLEWMRQMHAGAISTDRNVSPNMARMDWDGGVRKAKYMAIQSMFDTVYQLRAQPWELVEKVLCSLRMNLACIDEAWLED